LREKEIASKGWLFGVNRNVSGSIDGELPNP